jgi:hypothetical protein
MDLLDVTNFALDRILNVSSKCPQQPMPGTPALVERPSPCDDAGTAGVVDLRLNPAYERFIDKLHALLRDDRADEAYDLVRAEQRAIHGRG